jgi:hypothetical protein
MWVGSCLKGTVTGECSSEEHIASIFDPDDGDDKFFRNIGLSPNYTVSAQKVIPFIVTVLRT